MICASCYGPSEGDFCLSCRKKLFHKKRVSSKLEFDPKQYAGDKESNNFFTVYLKGKKLEYFNPQNNPDNTQEYLFYSLKSITREKEYRLIEEMAENEHLTMQIADQLYDIDTAANGLVLLPDGNHAFLVQRFDLYNTEQYYSENFEQLILRVKQKVGTGFQFDGNYEEIAKLVMKYVSAYIPALEELYKRIIFNYLFSCFIIDFKDFSIIKTSNGECKLSPAYNLLNMELHTDINLDAGLKLYKDERLSSLLSIQGYLRPAYFLEFANRIGIVKSRAEKMLNKFQQVDQPVIERIRASFLSETAKERYISLFSEKLKRIRD